MTSSDDVTRLLRELYRAWLTGLSSQVRGHSRHADTRTVFARKRFDGPLGSLVRLLWLNRDRLAIGSSSYGYDAERQCLWCERSALSTLLKAPSEEYRTLAAYGKERAEVFRPDRQFATVTHAILSIDEPIFRWDAVIGGEVRTLAIRELGHEPSDDGHPVRVPIGGSDNKIIRVGLRTRDEISDALVVPAEQVAREVKSLSQKRRAQLLMPCVEGPRDSATGVHPSGQVKPGIRRVAGTSREVLLHQKEHEVPLFRGRLLGQSLPDRLLLTGVAGAGKTTTAMLLLSNDERDLIVIEPTADRAAAAPYAGMGLPVLIENIGPDDVRFIERIASQLPDDVPLIVTSRRDVVLDDFVHQRVPDASPRSFIDDVVDHCARHFGASPLDWPQHTRTVDRVERERPETISSIFAYVAQELGYRLPHDREPNVRRWRRRIPAPDTEAWAVLLAIATLATAHRENEIVPRQVIERYSSFLGTSVVVIDRLRHDGWISAAGQELYVPANQLDSLRDAMWDADAHETRPSVVRWLATTEDAGIPREDHERLLEGLSRHVHWPVHYDELTGVRERRDHYRSEMCSLIAKRLYHRYEHPPWWMIVALADAGRFDLVMPLSDDDLSRDWGRLLHPARNHVCFEALFDRAMRDGREVNYLARPAVGLAIEEGNRAVVDAALRIVREHGSAQDLREWEAFVRQALEVASTQG